MQRVQHISALDSRSLTSLLRFATLSSISSRPDTSYQLTSAPSNHWSRKQMQAMDTSTRRGKCVRQVLLADKAERRAKHAADSPLDIRRCAYKCSCKKLCLVQYRADEMSSACEANDLVSSCAPSQWPRFFHLQSAPLPDDFQSWLPRSPQAVLGDPPVPLPCEPMTVLRGPVAPGSPNQPHAAPAAKVLREHMICRRGPVARDDPGRLKSAQAGKAAQLFHILQRIRDSPSWACSSTWSK